MKTPEEILKHRQCYTDFDGDEVHCYLDELLEAMQEYAKQEAIAFKKWCDDDGNEVKLQVQLDKSIEDADDEDLPYRNITHAELYTEYLTSKNK